MLVRSTEYRENLGSLAGTWTKKEEAARVEVIQVCIFSGLTSTGHQCDQTGLVVRTPVVL